MDTRDELTRQFFDETTIKIVDNTGGEFLEWFDGDKLRIARLSGAPAKSEVTIDYLEDRGFKISAIGEFLAAPMVRLILQAADEQYPSLFIMNSAFVLPPELRRRKLGALNSQPRI